MDLSDTKGGWRGEGVLFLYRKANSSFCLCSSFFYFLNFYFFMSNLIKSADPSKIDSLVVGWMILTPDLMKSHSQVSGPEPEPSCCYMDTMGESFQKGF